MRDYPLPCGEPEHVNDPELIKQKLKAGEEGFIRFLLKSPAQIKKNQIPFLPNYDNEIKKTVKGGWFLYTKLFRVFYKQYKLLGKQIIIYTDFWIFKEKKGCVNKFLDYCKKSEAKRGKMLANALYGVLGKNNFSGYHYHPFMLAVNHLAVLKTYYLYRQFKPENVLAIRSDCIYVQEDLPSNILKQANLYHLTKYSRIGLKGQETLFIYDTQELKTREINSEIEREKLKQEFKKSQKS